jgi:hypothetical protein
MQRVHVSPAFGKRRVETIESDDIERLAKAMLRKRHAKDGQERHDVPAFDLRPPVCANGLTGMSRLLTATQVAERLGVKPGWVWARARPGPL